MWLVSLGCRTEPAPSPPPDPPAGGPTTTSTSTPDVTDPLAGAIPFDIADDADLTWRPSPHAGIDGIGDGDGGMYPAGDVTGDGLADVWVAVARLREYDVDGHDDLLFAGWALLPGGGGGGVPTEAAVLVEDRFDWLLGADVDADGTIETVGGNNDRYAIWSASSPPALPDVEIVLPDEHFPTTTFATARGIPDPPGGVIFAPDMTQSYPTAVYVLRGPLQGTMSAAVDADAQVHGEPGDYLGERLQIADVDGDGTSDLVVGRYPYLTVDESGALLFSGPLEGDLALSDATLALHGPGQIHADAVGDFDGDGSVELLVTGTARRDSCVWMVSGSASGVQSAEHASTGRWEAPFELSWLTFAVAIGDIDGTGTTDAAVAGPFFDGVADSSGVALIELEAPRGHVDVHDAAAFAIHGSGPWEYVGETVWSDGDYDGDGVPDLVAGSPHHNDPDGGEGVLSVFSGVRFQ
jgi:hypothetical protein